MPLPKIQFGIDWGRMARDQGKKEIPLFHRHQFCAYWNCGNGAFYHRKERISALWPDFQWHRWNERRLREVCDYHWVLWLGPAGSTKTTDAAVFALEYWLQAPDRTRVMLCSTTKDALRGRIWGQAARYHARLPKDLGNVGIMRDSDTRILWEGGDHINGIFGMSVEDGPLETVLNNLIGFHTERVLLILDEMQGIRRAIVDATSNYISNPRFDMWGMGNPDSLTNSLGIESEPIGGWDSVERAVTPQWQTHGGPLSGNGVCGFYNGLESPADDSSAERERMPWLINKDIVAGILKACHGNTKDPRYWQFAIGWPPPSGLESTLLDDSIIVTFKCRRPAVWTSGFTLCAALDAAFGGGDDAILQFIRRGEVTELTDQAGPGKRRWMIEAREWMAVPIDADSTTPIHYQIMQFVRAQCQQRGIPPKEFALDSSGEGGGLKAIFDKEWGVVNGIESGGSPSELPIDETGKTAREAYDNRSSELCFSLREFALADGIRGLSEEVVKQACARRTFYRNGKWCVEPKTGNKGRTDEKGRPVRGYKQRMGHSPDHKDAFCVGVEHCRQMGAIPALMGAAVGVKPQGEEEEILNEFDEANYLLEQV